MTPTPTEQHAPLPHADAEESATKRLVPPAKPSRQTDRVAKETFESVLIALVFALVFRAYIVEAFIIPTGSMTPTLLGAHGRVTCDQCGYRFPLSASEATVRGDGQFPAVCPMCQFPHIIPAATPSSSGDRILVHKYLYTFSEPRRWDVTVFKAPHQPGMNYIKRLVGLPHEELAIIEGDLYTKPLDAPDGAFRVQRKVDPDVNPHWEEIQREVFQPIYHSQYVPLDRGQAPLRVEVARAADLHTAWRTPWQPTAGRWDMTVNGGRSYAFWGEGGGRLTFDFDATAELTPEAEYPYNQGNLRPNHIDPLEDVRLAAAVQPTGSTPVAVTLQTSARLDDPAAGSEPVRATLAADGTLGVTVGQGNRQRPMTNDLGPGVVDVGVFPIGRATPIELWYVDSQISVWVDGDQVFRHDIDVPFDIITRRPMPEPHPEVAIEITGGPATLHRVQLDRDLYYGTRDANNNRARGARERNTPGQLGSPGERVRLGPDEFFMVGDNGPLSHDGRFWKDVDPWIAQRMGDDLQPGIVRRRLLIGRAFFVYFPAPHYLGGPTGRVPVPNFGQMRFIH